MERNAYIGVCLYVKTTQVWGDKGKHGIARFLIGSGEPLNSEPFVVCLSLDLSVLWLSWLIKACFPSAFTWNLAVLLLVFAYFAFYSLCNHSVQAIMLWAYCRVLVGNRLAYLLLHHNNSSNNNYYVLSLKFASLALDALNSSFKSHTSLTISPCGSLRQERARIAIAGPMGEDQWWSSKELACLICFCPMCP